MYDLPPDLDRLRTLETWLNLTLDRVRQQIKNVEQEDQPQQPAPPPRPRTPDWGLLYLGGTAEIHRGDCWATGRALQPITTDRARAELADGAKACDICRPDRPLGMPQAGP